LSGFTSWKPRKHAHQWLIFPENMGTHLSIDEVALSQGELYTIVTNKKAKGKKGSLIGIISGTKTEEVIEHLSKIDYNKRLSVKEITLDMANSMKLIAKKSFPKATQVTDRFHVQKLALEALQEIRIKHRWIAMNQENKDIAEAKSKGKTYRQELLTNGDSVKQLLARTNASAESFNSKIKLFRTQFRGVRKVDFFLFRLSQLFS